MDKRKIITAAFLALFLIGTDGVFSQESSTGSELSQRGSIPQELLRPRRNEEAPRYPIDTVIGPLGQGRASEEAYRFARRIAVALLDGNAASPALSAVSRVNVENYINALSAVNPQFFRIGGGREEPDGSVSFLIRFAGREEGVMGELFIRHKEQRPAAPPPAPPPSEQQETAAEGETVAGGEAPAEGAVGEAAEETVQAPPPPPPPAPVVRVWVLEELVLEEPRTRDEEVRNSQHRYDFSPYERFF
jgi:hypothetical protein